MRGYEIQIKRRQFRPIIDPLKLAKLVGIHRNTLTDLENERINDPDMAERLIKAIDIVAQESGCVRKDEGVRTC